ncbi:MAG: type II toxin-antitoxin system PemK/MazF family toxin [Desulfatiglandales bacterium]|jgi:mRNA interferase MazF|nr:type II toxin-antitoxin system PemK/MazF family toxin [Desulfatiglandales bacterium]
MQRGDIWWATLRSPTGSELGYRRPVLIIQGDDFNKSRINTIVVTMLTSNLRLKVAPGNVFLAKRSTKLPKDSVANVSQVVTLDKSFLTKRISRLSAAKMEHVDEGLRLVLNFG